MQKQKTIRKKSKLLFNNVYFPISCLPKTSFPQQNKLSRNITKISSPNSKSQPKFKIKSQKHIYLQTKFINSNQLRSHTPQLVKTKRVVSYNRSNLRINSKELHQKLSRSTSQQISKNIVAKKPQEFELGQHNQNNHKYDVYLLKLKNEFKTETNLRKQKKQIKIQETCLTLQPKQINFQKIQYSKLFMTKNKYYQNKQRKKMEKNLQNNQQIMDKIQLNILSVNKNENENKKQEDEISSQENSSVSTFKSNHGEKDFWGEIVKKFINVRKKIESKTKLISKPTNNELSENYNYNKENKNGRRVNFIIQNQSPILTEDNILSNILETDHVYFYSKTLSISLPQFITIIRIELRPVYQEHKQVVILVWLQIQGHILVRKITWERKINQSLNIQQQLCKPKSQKYQLFKKILKKITGKSLKNTISIKQLRPKSLKHKTGIFSQLQKNYESQTKTNKLIEQQIQKKNIIIQTANKQSGSERLFEINPPQDHWLNNLTLFLSNYSQIKRSFQGYKIIQLENRPNEAKKNSKDNQGDQKLKVKKNELYVIIKLNQTFYFCQCVKEEKNTYPRIYLKCDLTSQRIAADNEDILTNDIIYFYIVELFSKINKHPISPKPKSCQIFDLPSFYDGKFSKTNNQRRITIQLHQFIISDSLNYSNRCQNHKKLSQQKNQYKQNELKIYKNTFVKLRVNPQTQRQNNKLENQMAEWKCRQLNFMDKTITNFFKYHHSFDYGVKISHKQILHGFIGNSMFFIEQMECPRIKRQQRYLLSIMERQNQYKFIIQGQYEKQIFLILNLPYHLPPMLNEFYFKNLVQVYKRRLSQRQVFAANKQQQSIKFKKNTKQTKIQMIKLSLESSFLEKFTLIKDRNRKVQVSINKSVIVLWFCQIRTLRFQKFIFPYTTYKSIMERIKKKFQDSDVLVQNKLIDDKKQYRNQINNFNNLEQIKDMERFLNMLYFQKKIVYSGYTFKQSYVPLISQAIQQQEQYQYKQINQSYGSNVFYSNKLINQYSRTQISKNFYNHKSRMGENYTIIYKSCRKIFHGIFIIIVIYKLINYNLQEIKFYLPFSKKTYFCEFNFEYQQMNVNIEKFISYLKDKFFEKYIQKQSLKIHKRLVEQYGYIANHIQITSIRHQQKILNEESITKKQPRRGKRLQRLSSLALSTLTGNFKLAEQCWCFFHTSQTNQNYFIRLTFPNKNSNDLTLEDGTYPLQRQQISLQVYKGSMWGYLHFKISLNEINQLMTPKNIRDVSNHHQSKYLVTNYLELKKIQKKIRQAISQGYQKISQIAEECRRALNIKNKSSYRRLNIQISDQYIIEIRKKINISNLQSSKTIKNQQAYWINFQWRKTGENQNFTKWEGSFGCVIPLKKFNIRMFRRLCKDVKQSRL